MSHSHVSYASHTSLSGDSHHTRALAARQVNTSATTHTDALAVKPFTSANTIGFRVPSTSSSAVSSSSLSSSELLGPSVSGGSCDDHHHNNNNSSRGKATREQSQQQRRYCRSPAALASTKGTTTATTANSDTTHKESTEANANLTCVSNSGRPLTKSNTTSSSASSRSSSYAQANDSHFLREAVLGEGSYSVVSLVTHLPTGVPFALKQITNIQLSHSRGDGGACWGTAAAGGGGGGGGPPSPWGKNVTAEQRIWWEVNIHRRLRHPNIVRLYSYYVSEARDSSGSSSDGGEEEEDEEGNVGSRGKGSKGDDTEETTEEEEVVLVPSPTRGPAAPPSVTVATRKRQRAETERGEEEEEATTHATGKSNSAKKKETEYIVNLVLEYCEGGTLADRLRRAATAAAAAAAQHNDSTSADTDGSGAIHLRNHTDDNHDNNYNTTCKNSSNNRHRCRPSVCGLSEGRALRYTRHIARALRYLHDDCGVAHRDIKAENILIDGNDVAKLTDFGWAKAVAPPPGAGKESSRAASAAPSVAVSPTASMLFLDEKLQAGQQHQQGQQINEDDADRSRACRDHQTAQEEVVEVETETETGRPTVCGTLDYLSPEMVRSGQRAHTQQPQQQQQCQAHKRDVGDKDAGEKRPRLEGREHDQKQREPYSLSSGSAADTPSSSSQHDTTRAQRTSGIDYMASDVWSLGIVLAEMLFGRSPFYRPTWQATLRAIVQEDPFKDEDEDNDRERQEHHASAGGAGDGASPPPSAHPSHTVSPAARELLRWMLHKDPSRRPTAAQLAEHPLLQKRSRQGPPAAPSS